MTRRPVLLIRILAVLAAAVLLHVPALGRAQGLSPMEERITRNVDDQMEASIALLERTVNINSGTMNFAGVRRVAEVMRAELEALGFDVRWIEMPDSVNRAGHLVAERNGSKGKRLLLIGHLDTVFEEDSPFQRFAREGDVAKGPGVGDMKGGNMVIIAALKALHAAGALEDTRIIVAFTGDEESPGRPLSIARRDLIEAGKRADIALGFEGGVRDGTVEYATIARRSSSGWTLRVTGTRAHSSGIFSEGVGSGAIFEAARILDAFHEGVRGEEYLTFNPGVIVGGTDVEYDGQQHRGTAFGKTNVVAQTVVVDGGIRTISNEQLERARRKMRAVVERSHPGTSAEITFTDGYPAMPPTEGNRALLRVFDAVSRDLGYGPIRALDPGRRGAADISFVAPYTDGLAGLGGYGSGSHTPDETLDLASLPRVIKRAAILIYRLTREEPAS